MNARELIARRAAQELSDGEVVNLGFGMPTACANFLPEGVEVTLQSENGCFGFGGTPEKAEDACSDIANAGSEPITLPPGSSVFDLSFSLGMMRGGHLDTTILGALEVDQEGNIANWAANRKGHWWPGIGGAMDLTWGCKKVVATLQHCDNKGNSKILKKCSLPLTGVKCVNTIVTEKAVFEVTDKGLVLKEVAPGVTVDEVKQITEADFTVAPDVHEYKL